MRSVTKGIVEYDRIELLLTTPDHATLPIVEGNVVRLSIVDGAFATCSISSAGSSDELQAHYHRGVALTKSSTVNGIIRVMVAGTTRVKTTGAVAGYPLRYDYGTANSGILEATGTNPVADAATFVKNIAIAMEATDSDGYAVCIFDGVAGINTVDLAS